MSIEVSSSALEAPPYFIFLNDLFLYSRRCRTGQDVNSLQIVNLLVDIEKMNSRVKGKRDPVPIYAQMHVAPPPL